MKLVRILLLGVVLGAIILFMGCPEAEQMMGPVITDEPADTEPPTTVGEVKEPEEPTQATEEPTDPEQVVEQPKPEEPAVKPEEPVVTEPEPTQPEQPTTVEPDLVEPAEPEEPTPGPDPAEVTPVEVGSEYTFTLEGETYPGYNPSPGVQHILDTHPSAQLPHFEEAVRMEEVVDWVYRKVWMVYPDWETNPVSVDKMIAARRAVNAQFGLTQRLESTLISMYEEFLGYIPRSYYWWRVECFRLLLEHQEELRSDYYTIAEYDNLRFRFQESLEEGYIVGQTNPNN